MNVDVDVVAVPVVVAVLVGAALIVVIALVDVFVTTRAGSDIGTNIRKDVYDIYINYSIYPISIRKSKISI